MYLLAVWAGCKRSWAMLAPMVETVVVSKRVVPES